MNEEPWFRMRPSKFMAGCRGLKANEVKVYISLICRIMEHGAPVEEDHEILSTYCEMRPSSFAPALDRLIRLKKLIRTESGCLTNTFCDGEITWRESYSENARRAGQKSAKKRKENQGTAATPVQPEFNQKKEIREEIDKKEDPPIAPQGGHVALVAPDLDAEFEKVWQHYPRKVGIGSSERAWRKARKSASFTEITGPLGQFIRAIKGTPVDKIPHFSKWLNERRWLDDQSHAANRPRTM